MNSFRTLLLFFWLASLAAIGSGHPSIERWWVPVFGCVVAYGLKEHPIKIPKGHTLLLMGFVIWWLCMLVPIPEALLTVLQGSLGQYKLLLHTSLGLSTNTLAANPALHLFNGSTLLMLYGLYLLLTQHQSDMTKPLAHSILVFAIVGIVQRSIGADAIYGVIAVPSELRSPFFASFINGNHAAYLMVSGLFVADQAYRTSGKWAAQVILCIGIALCESRGGIGLGILSMAWIHLPKHRYKSMPAIIVASLVGLYLNDPMNLTHGRWDMWIDSLNLFDWAWITGLGFGGFGSTYPLVKSSPEYIQSSHLHMEYIEWVLNTGMVGTVFISLFLWRLIQKQSGNSSWFGAISILLIASLVDFPLQLNALAVFFVIALSQHSNLHTLATDTVRKSTQQESSRTMHRTMVFFPLLLAIVTALAPTKFDILNPAQATDLSAQLRSNPLNPTLLEQTLWMRIQALEKSSADPLEFSTQTKESAVEEIEDLHSIIVQHAHFYRSNIEAQRLLARWYRRVGSYNNSCQAWQRVWTLKTPILSDKREWMKEGLACDPNLWMVLTTLPDDVELLLTAAKLLDYQKQTEATRFCLERAFELETPPYHSALYLVQWLIQQSNHQRAWQMHRNTLLPGNHTKAEFCSHQKNKTELMRHYQVTQTSKQYELLLQHCGFKEHWQNRLWMSGLKEGRHDILSAVDERVHSDQTLIPKYWKLLAHGYALNDNSERACHWIERAFHTGQEISEKNVSRCANGQTPLPDPQWTLQTADQIDEATK